MKRIAVVITRKLIQHQIISEDDQEIYQYGFWQGMVLIINTISVMAIGLLFGMFWQSLVFTVVYGTLRIYAGGYHAGTQSRCYALSILLITIALLALKLIPWNTLLCTVATSLSGVIIFMLAPVEDSNKPLDKIEQKEYRKRTVIIFLVLAATTYVFMWFQRMDIVATIVISIVAATIMVLVGKVKNYAIFFRTRRLSS